jgi:tetratricopeptide (TPR) repeat protein
MTPTALLLIAALGAAPVEPAAAAKESFAAGKKLYDQAKFADAVVKFEEAYRLKPHPVIFFNIGKCYEAMGETGKAMRAFRDYLRLLPDATDRQNVVDAIANLERRLRERGVQQLLVFVDPPNAAVAIDGKPITGNPASAELTAGSHQLTAKLDGYDDLARTFNFNIQRSSEMTINLTVKGTAVAGNDAPKKMPDVDLTPPPTPPSATVTSAPSRHRTWTWVAGGVAVAGLGAAIGMGVVSSGASNELKGSQHDRLQADALASKTQSMALGANVTYGVAGAAAITAVVLFFLEGRP